MTNCTESLTQPIGAQNGSFARLLAMLLAQYLSWRRRRRDQDALLRQPDYLLRDIGLERREIEIAVRGDRLF